MTWFVDMLGQTSLVTQIIVSLAVMMLFGFLLTRLTKLVKLPNVTGYIIAGIIIGPYCLNLVPSGIITKLDFVLDIALAFIAFSVGEFFKLDTLKKSGWKIIVLTIFEALMASIVVFVVMFFILHISLSFSIVLAALASTIASMLDVFFIETYGLSFPIISLGAVIALASISNSSIIFSAKSQIRGLTTSASLWACGIIGLCVGVGFYTIALIGFAILLCSLSLLPGAERFLKNRSNHFEIHLELDNKSSLPNFMTTIRELGLRIDEIELNSAYLNSGLSVYSVSLTIISPELKKYKTHTEIISAIQSLEYVNHIEEMK